ncbi:MAG: hypothetical protein EZS26_000130 [Candidatus Ordinivivax streblomastigis]|uniref:VCBS repeat-containing protein n=1 Tax=Candidatus Ordinivivax streblomastigis TaxID=2540710 RepID=A0A5M8P4Y9_9BACT|nr:MAG: hypothetical protein EZS26_000130 [Candidatus Ordinivivax streblomastigis]
MRKTFLLFVVLVLFGYTLQAQVKPVDWQVITSGSEVLVAPGSEPGGGHLVWGDFNNDGYKDAFFIGGQSSRSANLFVNNGDNTFTKVENEAFKPLRQAGAVFIDYDNDGDLDLVTMGLGLGDDSKESHKAIAYKNTGATGNYVYVKDDEQSGKIGGYGVHASSGNSAGRIIQAVDYDNDGWMDLLISGDGNYNVYEWNPTEKDGAGDWGWLNSFTAILRNEGGLFNIKHDLVVNGEGRKNFDYTRKGSVNVGDVNHDGYADFLSQGYSDYTQGGWIARLYINNQDGAFTQSDYSSNLNGNEEYETIFADINADGYDDLVEISRAVANIHINNQAGGFTKYEESGLIKSVGSQLTAGDINNDGLLDIVVTGMNGEGENSDLGATKIFYNNGDLTFTVAEVPQEMRARSGGASFVDINNDRNLDYSNTGYSDGWNSAIALNILGEEITTNAAPTAPTELSIAAYAEGKYTLSWTAATDAETATAALRYNVYAKNLDTDAEYSYAPVDVATGRLNVGGEIVPLIHGTSFDWKLPQGNYSFAVQAIDQADAASLFALPDITAQAPLDYQNGVQKTIESALISNTSTLEDVTFLLPDALSFLPTSATLKDGAAGFTISTPTIAGNGAGTANSLAVTITFAPTAAQEYVDTLIISAEGTNSFILPLKGTGTQPVITADSTSVDFGIVELTESKTSSVITILVTDPIAVSDTPEGFNLSLVKAATYVDSDSIFKVVSSVQDIQVTDPITYAITVSFTPKAQQEYTDTLIIRSQYADDLRIPLKGTGHITTGISGIDSSDKVVTTQYYTLQGVAINSPIIGGVYIKKEIYATQKTKVSKVLYDDVK